MSFLLGAIIGGTVALIVIWLVLEITEMMR